MLYVATEVQSWKAKQIRLNPNVALNVTIPKHIPFMPWIKVHAATIAFSGTARVLAAGDADPEVIQALIRGMAEHPERVANASLHETHPSGDFVTYGVGVPLLHMRDPKWGTRPRSRKLSAEARMPPASRQGAQYRAVRCVSRMNSSRSEGRPKGQNTMAMAS